MIATLKIKLESQMLGKNRDRDGIRRFPRVRGGYIEINRSAWTGLVAAACRDLGIKLDPTHIMPPQGFSAPSLHLFRRQAGPGVRECHESIRKGTVLTFDIVIQQSEDWDKDRCNDVLKQVETVLNHVGSYMGLSHYGARKGYGRFFVQSLEPLR